MLLDASVTQAGGSPGALAYVATPSSSWQGAAGVADRQTGEPMRPGLRYRIGSSTKTFTAVVVMQLVQEGRLGLDNSIAKYLPGLLPYPDAITVRQILNHTSGLFDWAHTDGNPDPATDIPRIRDPILHNQAEQLLAAINAGKPALATPELVVAAATTHPLNFTPGTSWAYSNTDYVVLTLLIQKLTDRSLGSAFQDRILGPLRLKDTYLPADRTIVGPHLHSYTLDASGITDTTSDVDLGHWGDGGLVSTAADLASFYRAVLSGKLVAPSLVHQMLQPVPNSSISTIGIGYGLGIYQMRSPCGLEAWGHGGDLGGYKTEAMASIGGKYVSIFVQNVATNVTEETRNSVTPQMLCIAAQSAASQGRLVPASWGRPALVNAGRLPSR